MAVPAPPLPRPPAERYPQSGIALYRRTGLGFWSRHPKLHRFRIEKSIERAPTHAERNHAPYFAILQFPHSPCCSTCNIPMRP